MTDLLGQADAALPLYVGAALAAVASVLVAWSADRITRSASRMAGYLNVSETVVGLTILAAGTSAPEFAVTALAAMEGQGDISVGNVVGSNIFNLGFILGTVAIIRPVITNRVLVWRDGLALIVGTAALLLLVGLDLELGPMDGAILMALLALYLHRLMRSTPHLGRGAAAPDGRAAPTPIPREVVVEGVRLVAALVLIAVSAQLLIFSAEGVARSLGLSDWVIGVTIVAAGTSLPELATSLAAALKGHYGLSAGAIIGSDLFNILGVLGLAGLINTVVIDEAARGALLALAGMVLLTVVLMRSGWRVSRLEGVLLLCLGLLRWALDLAGRSG